MKNRFYRKTKEFFHSLFSNDAIIKICAIHPMINSQFIVTTKRGVFIISPNGLFKVLDGHYYGATLTDRHFFIFEKVSEHEGQILKIPYSLKNTKIDKENISVFLKGLSPGCHQIDIKYRQLYITDSYNNRVLKINIDNKKINEFFPKGTLERGRHSDNYAHINSIFITDDLIYIFCHNETKKTGVNSSILILTHEFKQLKEIPTNASNGHNIIDLNGDLIYCDSLNNALMINENIVFKADMFTRGLSITDEYFVLGGSEYAPRKYRDKVEGRLYFLDYKFKPINTVKIPGMVQEIRRIDGQDYALSMQKASY